MTIICAISSKEGTFIGSDTMLSAGNRAIPGKQKWFTYRNWGIALAGDWRVANILDNHKKELLSGIKNEVDLVDKLYNLFENAGIGGGSAGDFVKPFGQSILLAKKEGPVWEIDSNLSVIDIPCNTLAAVGTGEDYAVGAAYILEGSCTARERLEKALETAVKFCIDCGGPLWISKL